MAVDSPEQLTDFPEEVRNYLKERAAGNHIPATLDTMLPGAEYASVRQQLETTGIGMVRSKDGKEHFLAVNRDATGKITEMAAAIPRNPGKSYDFLQQVTDFQDALTSTQQSRKDAVALFNKVYRAEGIINNAINKMAALVAPNGRFKVKSVRGQRGKGGDKVSIELETSLNWWKEHVNTRGLEAVITGARGVRSFVRRGARLALIEGDHIARHIWPTKKVDIPNLKPFTLPMNLQTFSAQNIEIPDGLEGTDFEVLYWVPPSTFIQTLRNPKDPELKKRLDKLIPAKVKSALLKDGKYLLDDTLMMHIKNRGTGTDTFGESVIESSLSDVRYKRALDALELTTITNLINRLVIIKVGSDNDKSVYHKAEVSTSRLGLLQRTMQNVGPSAMVLWAGPDIDVVEVSAHNAIMSLDDRYRIAERRILMAIGVPVVLLIGEGNDGKATGFAAALGVAAQLKELQDQYAGALVDLAERIADQNGYEEVEVVWEWTDNLLENKEAAAELILKMFQLGLVGTQTAMEELGFDHGAEAIRQAEDVSAGYKDQPFGPPPGAQTTNATGTGGASGGRPTKEQNPKQDPRTGKEAPSTQQG